jgi:hypothetical protein
MSRTRNTVLEYNRLAYEEGWNLAGIACTTSRTRNAGSGRPKRALEEQSSSTDSDYEADEESASEQEEVAVEEDFTDEELEEEVAAVLVEDQDDDAKPRPTRLLLELESLKKCMEKHCRCLKCNGPVKMEVKTLCIASNVMVYCIDKGCGYVDVSDMPATQQKLEELQQPLVNVQLTLPSTSCMFSDSWSVEMGQQRQVGCLD